MKNKQARNKTLCLNFCSYYKPGSDEGLACRGYEVVERLIQRGKSIDLAESGREFDPVRAESLVQRMCMNCDFQKDGCDYMLDRLVPPCGGVVLLARMLDEGTITIEDIS
jgi:hypothetical protein